MAINKGDAVIMNNLGYHYDMIEKNYELAKKYYLMAVQHNNKEAMLNLGLYYESICDYVQMKKYYQMAIENLCSDSMYYMACYYENININYQKMIKYYQMAIDNGDIESLYSLGLYYQHKEKNFTLMKKYYQMAINKNHKNKKSLIQIIENHEKQNQFMKNKRKYQKLEECVICYSNKEVMPYDCFNHDMCEDCYSKINQCPFCQIKKHSVMINK